MAKITVTDRNEAKYLLALGFKLTTAPRCTSMLDFIFESSDDFFEARKNFSLNGPVPIMDFIFASREVDQKIYEHKKQLLI